MTVVGVGTYHWVQASGPWNIAERTKTQLMVMEAMIWNDAEWRMPNMISYVCHCLRGPWQDARTRWNTPWKCLTPTPIGEYLQSGINQEAPILRGMITQGAPERSSLVHHVHLNRVHQPQLNMLQERSS
ncbi:hypothetical protein B9Z55_009002 [Caenorhabditis nigoni]|uniref:Uncharacterized protein n=1 Tax=Caenorhabditis nigoni TaxID=1611254 RepID=A0A2G5UQX2_9PELO|nr:hypothetical protein B9Z55_009002 [Caenorhabditis nigoni]